MHALANCGFSQKRKASKRPRDLHIRKVSFSGSSLSSGCSLSSSASTASVRTAFHHPLQSAPPTASSAIHAPLRLHERPYIRRDSAGSEGSRTGYYGEPLNFFDDDSEDDVAVSDDEGEDFGVHEISRQSRNMQLPPHASPSEHHAYETQEPTDYFFVTMAMRPQLPKSRWSESTIQTVDQVMATPGSVMSTSSILEEGEDYFGGGAVAPIVDATEEEEEEQTPEQDKSQRTATLNFSYKRDTVMSAPAAPLSSERPTLAAPRTTRPPMKTMDSVEEFIKRGGWKRKGVVFHQEEVCPSSDEESI